MIAGSGNLNIQFVFVNCQFHDVDEVWVRCVAFCLFVCACVAAVVYAAVGHGSHGRAILEVNRSRVNPLRQSKVWKFPCGREPADGKRVMDRFGVLPEFASWLSGAASEPVPRRSTLAGVVCSGQQVVKLSVLRPQGMGGPRGSR